MSKLVTIIIPTYNYAEYVREAVVSVIGQTYRPIEIIVVDDGSQDNTREVLAEFINAGKIHYIYQDNKGLAAARNTGLRSSGGEYISFLDADDLMDEKKIEIQARYLDQHPECGVTFSDFRFFKDNDRSNLIKPPVHHSGELTLRDFIRGNFMPVHTTLVRQDVFKKAGYFDESLRECEDSDLWIRAMMAGIRFFYMDQVLAFYRLHGRQMVGSPVRLYKTLIEVITRYKEYDPASAGYAFAKYGLSVGKHLIYTGRKREGRGYLWGAVRYRKINIFTVIPLLLASCLFSGKTIQSMMRRLRNTGR